MSVFGSRLKRLREQKKISDSKWTQKYVADLIGVARPTYTAYENGTKEPPLDTINRIADLFDVKIDYLQGRTDIPRGGESGGAAYYGGGEDWTDEEKELARATVEAYRKKKKEIEGKHNK